MDMDREYENIADESVQRVLREMWRRLKAAQAENDRLLVENAGALESVRSTLVALELRVQQLERKPGNR